ncbi:phage holin family protein [Sphingomonas sp. CJ20]
MGEPDADQNIGALLGQLVEDGKGLARAELGYYYAIARAKLREVRNSLWLGAVALGLAQAAIIALIVGLVLTLSPLVGPGFATLIVVGVTGALAALAARLAWLQVKRVLKDRP